MDKYNTLMTNDVFVEAIPYSNVGRITSSELEEMFNCKGSDVRKKVHSLRTVGVPICADKEGYFLAVSEEEIVKTIKSMASRAKSINEAISGLNKIAKCMNKEKDNVNK